MYIAGLDLPSLSPSQWLEVLVVLTTGNFIRKTTTQTKALAVVSESKAGRIRPESMPPTLLGRIVSPIHGLATFVPPLIYIGALALNRFQRPEWIARFALPSDLVSSACRNTLRVGACVATFAAGRFVDYIFQHLGDQWHVIGRREKPRIVKTGPYAWVRHPGYSSVLVQEALWSVMFWSYVPLVALGITASAFAIKMPIEEGLILKDDVVRDEYQQYTKEVPARILPWIW